MFWVDKIEDIINRTKVKYLDIKLKRILDFSKVKIKKN